MSEFWDIYDENRNLTGKIHERGKPLAKGEYHLVVHIWVQNENGEFCRYDYIEDLMAKI